MDQDLDYQADMLAAKTRHYLITMMGRTSDEANLDECYRALSYAMREETMINWLTTSRTFLQNDCRMLHYLSMEYLPGRLFSNNITNICSLDIVRMVMHKMNRSFAEIIARESEPGLGNGGLGRLASCFLDSLATQHLPARAYGLRYQYGTFEQQLWDGVQIEAPDPWLIHENPWEFRRDLRRVSVKFGGISKSEMNIHGDEIYFLKDFEEVWALPFDFPVIGYSNNQRFSVLTLRLWATNESPRNFHLQSYNAGRLDQASENTTLTDVLYPSDYHETGRRIRLKQEFLLVSASLQDIIRHYLETHENFRAFSDKVRIQINDTHPALVIPELIRVLTMKYDLPWKMAFEMTQAVTGYTNHTILKEALEEWEQNLMSYLLPRQFKVIERLNLEFCNAVRTKYPDNEDKVRAVSIIENGRVRMAHLAIYGSHKVNGVSAIHSEILKKRVFKDFDEMFPDRFTNVTNGVTQRRWLLHCNPDLAKFITKRIGDGWITDFSVIGKIADFAADPETQREFLDIKRKNKQRLMHFLARENKMRDASGNVIGETPLLEIDSLFDVQIKRIHEYKRQLMNALHVLMLYDEILDTRDHGRCKRTIIFAGKAAAGYIRAKDIIRLLFCVARKVNNDPKSNGALRVIFVENYNVSKAELIIPAADLSEQISTAGMEASGTGNMKLSMNGALTIGTNDGANIEMRQSVTDRWWPFTMGISAEEAETLNNNQSYRSWDIVANNTKIRRALDRLRDGSLVVNELEQQCLTALYQSLMEGHYGAVADQYFILKDLESYYTTQQKVEKLFMEPLVWAEYALHNIAGMGPFSADVSIKNYSQLIWGLQPCPPDEKILAKVRHEYSEHDRCRILIS